MAVSWLMLVSELQLLVDGGEFLQRLEAVPVHGLLVGHHVLERDTAMGAYLAVRDDTLFELLDEERTRDVEEIGRLLRREFGVNRDQRHGVALGHLRQNVVEQAGGGERNGNALLGLILRGHAELKRRCRLCVEAQRESSA